MSQSTPSETAPADTKTRILDAAEALFAERGFAATSLRDITAGAKVNLAAVNYHFGSKDALLSAVFDRRLGPVNAERLRLLGELEQEATGARLGLEDVLQAFLIPPFRKMQEWGDSGMKFMQLVGRTHSEASDQMRASFFQHFEEVFARFTDAFGDALPDLSPHDVRLRMHFVIGAMAHTLAWSQQLARDAGARPDHAESMLGALVQFAAAGMAAPPRVGITGDSR